MSGTIHPNGIGPPQTCASKVCFRSQTVADTGVETTLRPTANSRISAFETWNRSNPDPYTTPESLAGFGESTPLTFSHPCTLVYSHFAPPPCFLPAARRLLDHRSPPSSCSGTNGRNPWIQPSATPSSRHLHVGNRATRTRPPWSYCVRHGRKSDNRSC